MESIEPGRKELVKKCGTYWRFEFGSTFVGLGLQVHTFLQLQPNLVLAPKVLEEVLVVLEAAAVMVEVAAVVVAALVLV